jgi:hypothetical protein
MEPVADGTHVSQDEVDALRFETETQSGPATTTVNVVQAEKAIDYSNLTDDQVQQIEDLASQIPVLFKESKGGLKTTEFWLTVITIVLLNVNLIPLPDSWQGIASAALVVVYALSRGLAKKGVPDAEPVKPTEG